MWEWGFEPGQPNSREPDGGSAEDLSWHLPFSTLPFQTSAENILQGHLYHAEEMKKQINVREEEMENKTPTGSGY